MITICYFSGCIVVQCNEYVQCNLFNNFYIYRSSSAENNSTKKFTNEDAKIELKRKQQELKEAKKDMDDLKNMLKEAKLEFSKNVQGLAEQVLYQITKIILITSKMSCISCCLYNVIAFFLYHDTI